MNTNTKIEWCDATWNIVVGCKNACWYCYAKRMNDRFKWIPKWNEPQIFIKRLGEPSKIKKPSKIFVCSMSDLFGDWIPKEIIEEVIKVAKDNPRHTFQFLTKNPKRYSEFNFPENCWLGITIDGTENKIVAQNKISYLERKNNYRFISFEPLLGDVSYLSYDVNLVIIGAQTGPKAIKPKQKWIDSIRHSNIFYKNNIIKIYPQYAQKRIQTNKKTQRKNKEMNCEN